MYKTVKGIARTCLVSYYAFANKYPDATNEQLYKMLLDSRGYTEEKIKNIMTEVNSLSDVVHLVVMEEVPWELDDIVQTPLKSKYDIFEEDEPKLVETYRSLSEIVYTVIPDDI